MNQSGPESGLLEVSPDEVAALYQERGWSDGLPVVPASAELVSEWLEELHATELRHAVLGTMAPTYRAATLEAVVVNTIMAGGEPWHVPLVVAAVRALLEPRFNLPSVQATTHPCAVLVVFEDFTGDPRFRTKAGALGPGDRATAAIGRAVRLCMQNIGGARQGIEDRATQGSPAKFSYCLFASREDWPSQWRTGADGSATEARRPLRAHVYAVEGAHNVHDAANKTAIGILRTISDVLTTLGSNDQYFPFGSLPILLCPEHAEILGSDGFSSRDVQSCLYELARMPWDKLALGGRFEGRQWTTWMEELYRLHRTIPIVDRPENFHLYVVGGPGYHSAVNPSLGVGGYASTDVTDDFATALHSSE